MPLTFGAVGDVIAVTLLVKDVLDALDSSRGAAAEYQELKRELYILERILLEVEHLFRECSTTPELASTCNDAERTISDCRTSLTRFLERVDPFSNTLKEGSGADVLNKTARKVQWSLMRKDDVTKFRREVMAHSAFLNILLSSANLNLMQLNHQQLSSSLAQSTACTVDLLTNQGVKLLEICDRIDDSSSMIHQQASSLLQIEDKLDENHSLLRGQTAYLVDIQSQLLTRSGLAGDTVAAVTHLGRIVIRGADPRRLHKIVVDVQYSSYLFGTIEVAVGCAKLLLSVCIYVYFGFWVGPPELSRSIMIYSSVLSCFLMPYFFYRTRSTRLITRTVLSVVPTYS